MPGLQRQHHAGERAGEQHDRQRPDADRVELLDDVAAVDRPRDEAARRPGRRAAGTPEPRGPRASATRRRRRATSAAPPAPARGRDCAGAAAGRGCAAARSNSRLAAAARISRSSPAMNASSSACVRNWSRSSRRFRHRHVVALVHARQHVVDVLDDRRRRDAVLDVVRLLHAPAAVGLVDRAPHRVGAARRRTGSRGRGRCAPRGRWSESARPPIAGIPPCRRRESRPARPPAGRVPRAAG